MDSLRVVENMEEKLSLEWEEQGCAVTIKGCFEKSDMHRLALRNLGKERDGDTRYTIVNLLEADYSLISQRDISLVIAHTFDASSSNPGMKLAIAATDPRVVEMCEYYMSIMAKLEIGWEARLFRTMEEARGWIEA